MLVLPTRVMVKTVGMVTVVRLEGRGGLDNSPQQPDTRDPEFFFSLPINHSNTAAAVVPCVLPLHSTAQSSTSQRLRLLWWSHPRLLSRHRTTYLPPPQILLLLSHNHSALTCRGPPPVQYCDVALHKQGVEESANVVQIVASILVTLL